jgi:hypothetical protein
MIITILSLAILLAVQAKVCEDIVGINQNCTMLTPSLSCTNYNYEIYNTTDYIRNDTLTQLNSSIYYFIFNDTGTAGGYLVKICDGSTREIVVGGDEENMILAIVIFLMAINIISFGLPFWVKRFSESKATDYMLRKFMWIISIALLWFNLTLLRDMAISQGLGIDNYLAGYWWILTLAMMTITIVLIYVMTVGTLKLVEEAKMRERMGEERQY